MKPSEETRKERERKRTKESTPKRRPIPLLIQRAEKEQRKKEN
jgi:hypothetical protein